MWRTMDPMRAGPRLIVMRHALLVPAEGTTSPPNDLGGFSAAIFTEN